jgi:hypothetical protein
MGSHFQELDSVDRHVGLSVNYGAEHQPYDIVNVSNIRNLSTLQYTR